MAGTNPVTADAGAPKIVDQVKIRRLIARRHPEVAASMREWSFLKQAVEGGPAYVEGNLFQHPKEEKAVFEKRKERAADNHYNLTGLVLDTYQGYMFQREPTADHGNPECVEDFLQSADVERRPAVEFAKDVAYWMAGQGVTWVCVDKKPLPDVGPDEEGNPRRLTAAEEKEAGLKPYVYQVFATDVLDGKIKDGEILWLLIQERERDDADPIESSGEVITRFRLWTPDEWILITPIVQRDQNGNVTQQSDEEKQYKVESGPNGVGRVPFVPFRYYGKEGSFASASLVSDIAHIDRGIFNKASLLDEILYQVTFPQLCIPYAGELFDAQTGMLTGQGRQIMTMGLHSVIPFATEAGAPQYLVPSSGPADTLRTIIKENVGLALSLALLDGEMAAPGDQGAKAAASGVSQAWVFEKLNKRLSAIASTLEAGFRKVFELVCLWQGDDPKALPDTPWDWPESFEVRSLAQEVADMSAILAGNPPSDTFKIELWKRLVKKALPKLDDATEKKIMNEIQNGVPTDTQAMGQLLDTMQKGMLPAPAEEDEGAEEAEDQAEATREQAAATTGGPAKPKTTKTQAKPKAAKKPAGSGKGKAGERAGE